jgi:hypothetical protein
MDKHYSINLKEEIKISESYESFSESTSLSISSKNKIITLLSKSKLTEEDIIEIFINLHIVLEVGVNSFFRQLIIPTLKKEVRKHEMLENLDRISFLDKTIMFIYYSKFNFIDINKATHYHSVINKIRKFSDIRNKLLHGHSISSLYKDGQITDSNLKKKINIQTLNEQIGDFYFIIEGLRYYVDMLDSPIGLTEAGKESLKNEYLDTSFLPHQSQ